jgi:opacity protein-like surface antigen
MLKVLLGASLLVASIATVQAQEYVKGYVRSNGTYVAPHYRSSRDSSTLNNWSTRGNINPYQGLRGMPHP